MFFDILTIFPELFSSPLQEGILRRALASGKIEVNLHNIRDYALDKHHMTDDRPFGGGEGMVMKPEPLTACLNDIQKQQPPGRVVLLSPRGTPYNQKQAARLAGYPRLVLVCGRYEGVDERFTRQSVDEEISIGDYILTGGELAAMVLIDSITRLLPGVLGCAGSADNDTFSHGLLKHPQYTRPREFAGQAVPEELLSGNHAEIARYRFKESVRITAERRPDLLDQITFGKEETKLLHQVGLSDLITKGRTGNV
jgi:tRNA (guanine37-N1)-methyltransferase